MLYHLFDHLHQTSDIPGVGLFQFISFRAAAAALISLLVSIGIGRRIIEWLQLKQVGEIVRDLGLEGQLQKQGTPTMGGIIILSAILIPTLLLADLTNVYIQCMLLVTVILGGIGFHRRLHQSLQKEQGRTRGEVQGHWPDRCQLARGIDAVLEPPSPGQGVGTCQQHGGHRSANRGHRW